MNLKKVKNKLSFLLYPFILRRILFLIHKIKKLKNEDYIAFVLFWKMGDIILSTRIVHEIKIKNPLKKICYITSDSFKFVIKDNPEIDVILTVKMYKEDSFLRILNRPLWFLVKIIVKNSKHFKKSYFLQIYPEYTGDLDNSNKHLIDFFAEKANIKLNLKNPFFTNKNNKKYFKEFCKRNNLRRGMYITIGHRASTSEKTWPLEYFKKLGKKIISENPELKIIFIGSKKDEFPKDKKFICLKGKNLGEVAEIIKNSKFFIGLEGGLIHLASSFEIPLIGIYCGKTSLSVGKPLSKNFKLIIPKSKKIKDVKVIKVYEKIESLLKNDSKNP